MLAESLETFTPYGLLHFGAILMMVVVGVWLGMVRYRLRRQEPEARVMDRQVAAVVLGIWIISQGMEFLPNRYTKEESLPFHICDVVALVAAWGVCTDRRLPRAVLYYWGIGLSTQALAQPELAGGPVTMQFWVFWVPHSAIIVSAIYDLVGRGFSPTWRDYIFTVCSLLVYLAFVIPIDLWLKVNYGFVGNVDYGPLDFLGPWPMRVVKVSIGVLIALAVMTAPWTVVRVVVQRRKRRHGSSTFGAAQPTVAPKVPFSSSPGQRPVETANDDQMTSPEGADQLALDANSVGPPFQG